MPLSFRPNATVWIWLDADKDIEFDTRPRFKTRVFTCEQVDAWYEAADALIAGTGSHKDAVQLLLTHIVGWENFKGEFSADEMCKALTIREVWSLVRQLPGKVGLQEDDLGKSDSPSHTAGVASAEPVPADAATSPANVNPS